MTKQQLSAWLEMCFERALDARDAADATDGARRMLESLGDVADIAGAGCGRRGHAEHVQALLAAIDTDLAVGIRGSQVTERQAAYGRNVVTQEEPEPIWMIAWRVSVFVLKRNGRGSCTPLLTHTLIEQALQDPSLIFLCFAAAVSLCIGLLQHQGYEWLEGLAILAAVLIVVTVSATNDYHKEQQFRALREAQHDAQVLVVRDERAERVSVYDVVVGDVLVLSAGDLIPADGALFQANDLQVCEKALTGEATLKEKGPSRQGGEWHSPAVFAGTSVEHGEARMVVLAVGDMSYQARMGVAEELLGASAEGDEKEEAESEKADGKGVLQVSLPTRNGRHSPTR